MSIKLTLLKSGETLISEMKELVTDKEQKSPHAYLLDNPHIVQIKSKEFLTEEERKDNKFGIDLSIYSLGLLFLHLILLPLQLRQYQHLSVHT